jgi:hypothetical protein
VTASGVAQASDGGSVTGPRRRASAPSPTASLTLRSMISVGPMASPRAPWEGLAQTKSPQRRRLAPFDASTTPWGEPVRRQMSRRGSLPIALNARRPWEWIAQAVRRGAEREYKVEPSEWVPAVPSRFATARSFLPSRGVVVSTLVAVGSWAWVATCLQTVDPYAPYALIGLLVGVAVGIAATTAPALRVIALHYGRTRAFRESAWWHGVRQGALVGLAVAVNGGLLAFRQWAPIGAVVVGFGVIAVEGIILAVLLSARGRPDSLLH